MPAKITVECTECGAQLKMADRSKIGKKIRCPKCEAVFVAQTDDEDIEELDDDEEDEEEQRPRARKGAGGGKPGAGPSKGKGKKKKSGSNLGLIIGGAIAAVVLLVGGLIGVLYAAGAFGGKPSDPNQMTVNPAPGSGVFGSLLKTEAAGPGPAAAGNPPRSPLPEVAKWLPSDAEMVVHLRVSELMTAPLIQDLIKSNQLEEQINGPLAALGLTWTDVESVTFGLTGLEQAASQAQQAQMAVMMGRPQAAATGMPGAGVIKLKKPITYDAIMKLASETPIQKATHSGKEYLVGSPPKSPTKSGMYLTPDSLLIFAEEPALKQLIEKGTAGAGPANFGFVDWTDQFTLAMAPKNLDKIKQQRPPGGTGEPAMDQLLDAVSAGANGLSLGLNIKGGIDLEIAVGCADPQKQEAITKALNELLTKGKSEYEQAKGFLPPWSKPLTDQLMSNLKVDGSSRFAVLSTNLPDSAQQQLAQLPAMIMTQMMMSSMLPGGKGPETLPPDSPGDSPDPPITPGETTMSKAASAKGLPKSLELGGQLSDAFHRVGKGERPLGFSLQVEFQGDAKTFQYVAVGKLQQGVGKFPSGDSSILRIPERFGEDKDEDAWELLPNAEESLFLFAMPGNYELQIPLEEKSAFETIEGKFSLLTGKRSKLIYIKDLHQAAGKEPSDPALKEAGVKFELIKEMEGAAETEMLNISVGDGFLLTKVQVVNEKGEMSYDAFPGYSTNPRLQKLRPGVGGNELKKGLGLKFYVYSNLEEKEVEFQFKQVELPKPEKKEAGAE